MMGIIDDIGGDSDRTINSIVLLANWISFAIQIVMFLIIGSFAGSLMDLLLDDIGGRADIHRLWVLQALDPYLSVYLGIWNRIWMAGSTYGRQVGGSHRAVYRWP